MPSKGVNRIETDTEMPVFQMILGKEMNDNSEAVWIDSGNEASTYALSKACGHEALEKVTIGRAFTAFQHFTLINELEKHINKDTDFIILPNIDQQYVKGSEKERKDLFQHVTSKISSIKSSRPDITILYSIDCSKTSWIEKNMAEVTESTLRLEETAQGLNFNGKKKFYRYNGGLQTTLSCWNESKVASKAEVKYSGTNELDV